MLEPSDADIHARLSVVESDTKRHDDDLCKLWDKVTNLEVCAASLPQIESALAEITGKVDDLRISIAARDATVKADLASEKKNKPFFEKWQNLIAPILSSGLTGLVIFFLILFLHIYGATK